MKKEPLIGGKGPLHKYDTAEMRDPLVRCDNCAKLVSVLFINKNAGCNHCGNKRFQFIYSMNDKEMYELKEGIYDLGLKGYRVPKDYLDIFEAVKDE